MALIQYLFGIRSMSQTIKEIETNVAYRWFLGYGLTEKIPHFSVRKELSPFAFKTRIYLK
ncbi:transposase [Thermoactinomyces sp. CICC 10521]|uniref:Transposase n=1 Tax=Thermoactinomyces daqus TaxID=1329516 RepID=A0A7W1XCU8_9BACL|nr:transposase [Thermoactinomyces daqus]MBH8598176.1 transposase [Thermoactinomyces sp. CICC 10523]MBH8603206.1 transposase [Thermoactinomyces sp. CICC 10522]MBH8606987.1 transposase [Thermoactinomyces sp. CICC 10521]